MSDSHYSPRVRRPHWLVFPLAAVAPLLICIHEWIARRTAIHANAKWWPPGAWDFPGVSMPHVAPPDKVFAHQIEGIHGTLGTVLMYLAALHAAAALFHHFVQRDNALKRMLPPARVQD